MQYKLRTKGTKETVDVVSTSGDREARQFFQLKKNWKSALNVKIQVCRFRIYHHLMVVFDVPEKYFLLLQNLYF